MKNKNELRVINLDKIRKRLGKKLKNRKEGFYPGGFFEEDMLLRRDGKELVINMSYVYGSGEDDVTNCGLSFSFDYEDQNDDIMILEDRKNNNKIIKVKIDDEDIYKDEFYVERAIEIKVKDLLQLKNKTIDKIMSIVDDELKFDEKIRRDNIKYEKLKKIYPNFKDIEEKAYDKYRYRYPIERRKRSKILVNPKIRRRFKKIPNKTRMPHELRSIIKYKKMIEQPIKVGEMTQRKFKRKRK